MENINCPNCEILGVFNKVVKRGSFYFCTDVSCTLLENEQSYQKLLQDQKVKKQNQDSVLLVTNSFTSDNLIMGNEDLSSLFNDHESNSIVPSESNFESLWQSFEETVNAALYYSKQNNKIVQETSGQMNQLDTILTNPSKMMLNWIRFPCGIKAHNRILCAILIHLDVFATETIEYIKKEYKICEALANNFNIEKVRLFAFNFISKLYDVIEKLPNKLICDKHIHERLFLSMDKYLDKIDTDRKLYVEYTQKMFCASCGINTDTTEKNRYFIPIERNKYCLKLSENIISYKFDCPHCKGRINKSIKLTKVPRFVLLQYSNGMSEDVISYDGMLTNDDGESLQLIAIVQCMDSPPYSECPESQLTFDYYRSLIDRDENKQRFTVHIKTTEGWNVLGHDEEFLSAPTKSLEIEDVGNVQLLVMGTVTDSSKYLLNVSNEEYFERLANISQNTHFFTEETRSMPASPKRPRLENPVWNTVDVDDDDYMCPPRTRTRKSSIVTSSGVSSSSSVLFDRRECSPHSRTTASNWSHSTDSGVGERSITSEVFGGKDFDLDELISLCRSKVQKKRAFVKRTPPKKPKF